MSEWISVNERLPVKLGYYLVKRLGKPSCHEPPCETVEVSLFDGKGIGNVTHWADLPEAPEEEKFIKLQPTTSCFSAIPYGFHNS